MYLSVRPNRWVRLDWQDYDLGPWAVAECSSKDINWDTTISTFPRPRYRSFVSDPIHQRDSTYLPFLECHSLHYSNAAEHASQQSWLWQESWELCRKGEECVSDYNDTFSPVPVKFGFPSALPRHCRQPRIFHHDDAPRSCLVQFPGQKHMLAAEPVLSYPRQIWDRSDDLLLPWPSRKFESLVDRVDADWAVDTDTHRLHTGYILTMNFLSRSPPTLLRKTLSTAFWMICPLA